MSAIYGLIRSVTQFQICSETDIHSTLYTMLSTNPRTPTNIPNFSVPSIVAPDMLCVAEGLADIEDVDPELSPVGVTVALGILLDDPVVLELGSAEFVVVFGVLTKNQSAAIGAPKPVSATKLVRLKPTRLNTEAVKLLKYGI